MASSTFTAGASEIALGVGLDEIAGALARAAGALLAAEVEVVMTRSGRELARAGARIEAQDALARLEHRIAASGFDVALVARAGPSGEAARAECDVLVVLAALRAHERILHELARERREAIVAIAHDLRTPLQSLALGLDALDALLEDTSARESCASTFARMKRCIQTASHLVHELADGERKRG